MTVIISVLCRSRNGIVQIQTEELSFSWETSQSIRSDACGYSKSIMDHTCSTLAGLAIAEQIHSFPVLGVHGRCEEGRCVLCAVDVLEADETRGYFLCLGDMFTCFTAEWFHWQPWYKSVLISITFLRIALEFLFSSSVIENSCFQC